MKLKFKKLPLDPDPFVFRDYRLSETSIDVARRRLDTALRNCAALKAAAEAHALTLISKAQL